MIYRHGIVYIMNKAVCVVQRFRESLNGVLFSTSYILHTPEDDLITSKHSVVL